MFIPIFFFFFKTMFTYLNLQLPSWTSQNLLEFPSREVNRGHPVGQSRAVVEAAQNLIKAAAAILRTTYPSLRPHTTKMNSFNRLIFDLSPHILLDPSTKAHRPPRPPITLGCLNMPIVTVFVSPGSHLGAVIIHI